MTSDPRRLSWRGRGAEDADNSIDATAAAVFAAETADRPGQTVCVVMAAFDEEGGIGGVLAQIPSQVCGLSTEVLVVVDGARDRTAERARAGGALVCDVPVNRGQGAALRLGYALARQRGARFIATLDADGQYDPAQLETVVAPLVAGKADFVTGSRRLGRSHTTDAVRGAGVVVFGALITVLTRRRITDPANGLRAMRAEVTAVVPLRQPQYQAAELLVGAILRGFRVVEVATVMYPRSAGATKKGGNLAYGWRFARVIIGTWWRERGAAQSSAGVAGFGAAGVAGVAAPPGAAVGVAAPPGAAGVAGVAAPLGAAVGLGSTKITHS